MVKTKTQQQSTECSYMGVFIISTMVKAFEQDEWFSYWHELSGSKESLGCRHYMLHGPGTGPRLCLRVADFILCICSRLHCLVGSANIVGRSGLSNRKSPSLWRVYGKGLLQFKVVSHTGNSCSLLCMSSRSDCTSGSTGELHIVIPEIIVYRVDYTLCTLEVTFVLSNCITMTTRITETVDCSITNNVFKAHLE